MTETGGGILYLELTGDEVSASRLPVCVTQTMTSHLLGFSGMGWVELRCPGSGLFTGRERERQSETRLDADVQPYSASHTDLTGRNTHSDIRTAIPNCAWRFILITATRYFYLFGFSRGRIWTSGQADIIRRDRKSLPSLFLSA